jgi:hypothetical protein
MSVAYIANRTASPEPPREKRMNHQTVPVQLSEAELALLIEALDSHEYWQLSEPNERNDGYSTIEDGESEEVDAARALLSKLENFIQAAH